MRKAFIKTLTELAEKDNRIFILAGDLGFGVFDDFAKKFPGRFINCGVAEQNMMGVAAGLAMAGKKPYVYSIVPFVTLRCLEQIRNDICYQNLDVKIIGYAGGFSYGTLGSTHSVLEDVAVLRALPNMTVLCPADLSQTEGLIFKSYETSNPTYIRLMNIGENKVFSSSQDLEIGRPMVLAEGKDGAIIATGVEVNSCLEVIKKLKDNGLSFKLINAHTLKPIDKEKLLAEIKGIKNVFTVEEHSVIGGLGGAVAEILAESDWQGSFKIIAIPDEYPSEIGSADYLRKKYRLDAEQITTQILDANKQKTDAD
jgi:transketolase